MRHSIVLIRAALCQHAASSSPKEAKMIDRLLWLHEKQLLNRHTVASNCLALSQGKVFDSSRQQRTSFHLEKIWWRRCNPRGYRLYLGLAYDYRWQHRKLEVVIWAQWYYSCPSHIPDLDSVCLHSSWETVVGQGGGELALLWCDVVRAI